MRMLVLEINEVTRCQVQGLQSSLYKSFAFVGLERLGEDLRFPPRFVHWPAWRI